MHPTLYFEFRWYEVKMAECLCPTSRPLKANYSAIYKSGKVLAWYKCVKKFSIAIMTYITLPAITDSTGLVPGVVTIQV